MCYHNIIIHYNNRDKYKCTKGYVFTSLRKGQLNSRLSAAHFLQIVKRLAKGIAHNNIIIISIISIIIMQTQICHTGMNMEHTVCDTQLHTLLLGLECHLRLFRYNS